MDVWSGWLKMRGGWDCQDLEDLGHSRARLLIRFDQHSPVRTLHSCACSEYFHRRRMMRAEWRWGIRHRAWRSVTVVCYLVCSCRDEVNRSMIRARYVSVMVAPQLSFRGAPDGLSFNRVLIQANRYTSRREDADALQSR